MRKLLLTLAVVVTGLLGVVLPSAPAKAAGLTLYDCYQELNKGWPSVVDRAADAAVFGIWQYRGTAAQNIELSAQLCPVDQYGERLAGSYSVVTGYEKNLRVTMDSTQSYIPVTSLTLKDDTTLVMSALGDRVFLTLEPGTAREEIVVCTDINTSTINFTSCTRGLAFSGTSTASVAANRKPHSAGSKVVMSNVHYAYEQFVDTNDKAQTIQGQKTFSVIPYAPTTTPTDDRHLVTLYQLQQATSTGGINASETQAGKGEIATGSEAAAGTSIGSSGARLLLPASLATSTPSATTSVPVTGSDGKLDQTFLDLTENFTWTGTHSFTTTTAVSSTVTNLTVTATSTLATTTVNGTSLQPLIAGSSTTLHSHPRSFGTITMNVSAGTGSTTVAHNLGITPNRIRVRAVGAQNTSQNNNSYGIASSNSDEQASWENVENGAGLYSRGINSGSILYLDPNGTGLVAWDIYSIDSTNIIFNRTTMDQGGADWTFYVMWEAEL